MSLEASVRDWFDKLAPRERRLAGVFGGVLVVFLLLLVPIGVSAALGSSRDLNRSLSDAVLGIRNGREAVRLRQAKREAVANRYANHAPPLAGLLEKSARDNKLDIPESQDRPDLPHGKRYSERSTVVRLRKTTMLQLAKMLEAIESQRLPVSISRLNIRKRGGERDSYDVELGVSAFDRSETPAAGAPTGAATAPSPTGGSR